MDRNYSYLSSFNTRQSVDDEFHRVVDGKIITQDPIVKCSLHRKYSCFCHGGLIERGEVVPIRLDGH